MAELMSDSVIRDEISFSTGSFPSRHSCAKTGMSRAGTAEPR